MKIKHQKNNGFSLVEMMIALALSASLATALYQIVSSNSRSAQLANSFVNIQETARFAYEVLSSDIRMAGYQGCVNDYTNIVSNLDEDDVEFIEALHSLDQRIQAEDNYDDADDRLIGGIEPLAGTDIFTSSGVSTTQIVLSKTPSGASANLQVSGPQAEIDLIEEGMVIMITNCSTAEVFSVSNTTGGASPAVVHNTSVAGGPDNISVSLDELYPAGSEIMFVTGFTYFIAESQIIEGVNSLYRQHTLDGEAAVEISPFVDDMQLTYSVDTDGDGSPDQYKTASQIALDGDDMSSDVYSVHVELVISGQEHVDGKQLVGYDADGKLRKKFNRVINIRNAGLGQGS